MCCPFFDAEIYQWKCCSALWFTALGEGLVALPSPCGSNTHPSRCQALCTSQSTLLLRQDKLTLGKKQVLWTMKKWESPVTWFLWTLFTQWATKWRDPVGFVPHCAVSMRTQFYACLIFFQHQHNDYLILPSFTCLPQGNHTSFIVIFLS